MNFVRSRPSIAKSAVVSGLSVACLLAPMAWHATALEPDEPAADSAVASIQQSRPWGSPGAGIGEFSDAVIQRATDHFGERYVGIWMTRAQNHFEVAVNGLTREEKARSRKIFGGLPRVRLVARDFDNSALKAAARDVADVVGEAGVGSIGISPESGTVEVRVETAADRARVMAEIAAETDLAVRKGVAAADSAGVGDALSTISPDAPAVVVRVNPQAAPTAEDQSHLPMRAGKRIIVDDAWLCTSAFTVDGLNGQYELTAGHCGANGSSVSLWNQVELDHFHLGNIVNNTYWGSATNTGDVSVFNLLGEGAPTPSVHVATGSSPRPVTAQATAVVGMRMCARSATTNSESCGTVTNASTSVFYAATGGDGLIHTVNNMFEWQWDASYIGITGGASGGPVYYINPDGTAVALGVTSGSDESVRLAYATRIATALAQTHTTLAVTTARSPIGYMDTVGTGVGTLRVKGWAFDPDVALSPLSIHVYVGGPAGGGGTFLGATTANLSRPDVAAAYVGAGPNHGFDATFALGAGTKAVYAYAVDQGAVTASPKLLWSGTVTIG
jgi:hypothetical protein